MKDVLCYELFGGIALKNHAFSFKVMIIQDTQRWCTTLLANLLFDNEI